MKTNILFCGYSFHSQPFYSSFRTGFPGYLFRLQTEGSCRAAVNGKTTLLEKGDLLMVRPGDHYELMIDIPNKSGSTREAMSGDYHLACEGRWLDEWWGGTFESGVSRIELDESILSLWRHVIIEDRRPASEAYNEMSDYLLRALCISLKRAVNEAVQPFHLPPPVTKMMRYIEEHATTPLKASQIAGHGGLSVSRAGYLFKESLGKTMMEYVLEIRLSAAVERMKFTALTLEQIAEECGFGTYPYFHRIFRKKYGISPGAYRKMT